MNLSKSEIYGQSEARDYFNGRKGHGGQVEATRVVLTEAKLAAFLTLAFRAGQKEGR